MGAVNSAAACLFFHEDFREAETAAGKLFRIVVAHESHTFLADFREVYFPCTFCEQLGIGFRMGSLIRPRRVRPRLRSG